MSITRRTFLRGTAAAGTTGLLSLSHDWCCTGTGSEEYAKLNDSIYHRDDDAVYVNLFVPSTLAWRERGLRLRQTTQFPAEERITLRFDDAPARSTALKIRVPYWATSGGRVRINGVTRTLADKRSTVCSLAVAWCVSAPTPIARACLNGQSHEEMAMYWGGGLLGTILMIVLIVWLVRRM